MRNPTLLLSSSAAVCLLALGVAPARAELDLDEFRLVDLTHSLNSRTIYWPTSRTTFELERLSFGRTKDGYFYSANSFCTPEHGGTHLDAPIHFAEGGHTADQIPLERLIAPAVVIDISERAAADADYRLQIADVEAFETAHGRVPQGSMVLLRTGWSRFWPDRKRYLGDDTPGDASHLHFPSYGLEATRLLVEGRGVVALGIDSASIDYGQSRDFPVHRLAGGANVPGFENLASLDELPPTGATVFALPAKIEGGSGGPLRIVALVAKESGKEKTMSLQLGSPAFQMNGAIPAEYTCEGKDTSPALTWSGVPQGAKSLVLIVDDPDAPDPKAPKMTWVHWVLYNLPASAKGLPAGVRSNALPAGTREGKNDFKRTSYGGPCPPIGRHRYFHKLYALDVVLPDLGEPTKAKLLEAMKGHVLAEAELIGTYEKRK